MADRIRPWSRWDIPDGIGVGPFTQKQFDPIINAVPSTFIRTTLVGQKINTIDPSFYDCIYGLVNSNQTVTERCYKDLGCCSTGCCDNTDWSNKYGWAVALIVIFCALVIIAVVVWLIVWLINRSKDKRQKRLLIGGSGGLSPTPSQMSLAQPVHNGYHFGTGPYQTPPGSGYRY